MQCVISSAEGASQIAERSRNDLHALSLGSPLHLVHKVYERIKERRPRLSNPSAENNHFGIYSVDDRRDPCRQIMNRLQPDLSCSYITGQMCIDELARESKSSTGTSRQRAVADHLFKTAGCADDIGWTIRVQAEVSEMSGSTDVPFVETTIREDCAANTGTQCQQHCIAITHGGTFPSFTQQRRMSVVEHRHGMRSL